MLLVNHFKYPYHSSYTANVISTGGNSAGGIGNKVLTGGNGISAYGYQNGNNVVATGGNAASGIGNTVATGGNKINSSKISINYSKNRMNFTLKLYFLYRWWLLLAIQTILCWNSRFVNSVKMHVLLVNHSNISISFFIHSQCYKYWRQLCRWYWK